MSDALMGYGSKFQLESTVTPDLFTDLAEVFSITPPAMTVDQIDVSHMQSPNRTREFIDGMIDPGECSIEMNYVPGSASDLTLLAILATAPGSSRTRTCRIVYPNGASDTFDANLQSYEPDLSTDDKATATVSWRVTGAVTRIAAP